MRSSSRSEESVANRSVRGCVVVIVRLLDVPAPPMREVDAEAGAGGGAAKEARVLLDPEADADMVLSQ